MIHDVDNFLKGDFKYHRRVLYEHGPDPGEVLENGKASAEWHLDGDPGVISNITCLPVGKCEVDHDYNFTRMLKAVFVDTQGRMELDRESDTNSEDQKAASA
jgi:hypothetical protein